MFCTNCGKKLPENAAFCTACGQAIKKDSKNENIKKVPVKTNEDDVSKYSGAKDKTKVQNTSTDNQQSSGKKSVVIVAVVLVFLLVGAAAFYFAGGSQMIKGLFDKEVSDNSKTAASDENELDIVSKTLDNVCQLLKKKETDLSDNFSEADDIFIKNYYETTADDYSTQYMAAFYQNLEKACGSIEEISYVLTENEKMEKDDVEKINDKLSSLTSSNNALADDIYEIDLTLTVKGSKATKDIDFDDLYILVNEKGYLSLFLDAVTEDDDFPKVIFREYFNPLVNGELKVKLSRGVDKIFYDYYLEDLKEVINYKFDHSPFIDYGAVLNVNVEVKGESEFLDKDVKEKKKELISQIGGGDKKNLLNNIESINEYELEINLNGEKKEGTINYTGIYLTKTGDCWLVSDEIDYIETFNKEDGNDSQFSNDDDYVIPYSSYEKISEETAQSLSQAELRIAINEIYARYGRKFDDANLQSYFDSKSWYYGTIEPEAFDSSILNETEQYNIRLLSKYRQ
ncbi:zinc-ribbon domain-containing protein [Acetitomaculum ruminis DSM 5522]|uniref:Zinc-ribbon domain-containing protein n=1 Tax=Acetitomaculum ruminis DSM 5522 TaxID=1120918 RepID=A0A1I0WLZ2_9FIRM|nr:YARHG domain-containing protein [Acetitomaculum ruminis]SFA89023.1 zinc-ribbon domain-containing protein [Acetitomaculum ruminis DSM 5522]